MGTVGTNVLSYQPISIKQFIIPNEIPNASALDKYVANMGSGKNIFKPHTSKRTLDI